VCAKYVEKSSDKLPTIAIVPLFCQIWLSGEILPTTTPLKTLKYCRKK
jgi:hypothetical protein